ncbi:peptidylprolyl isomerase [Sphingomonas paeninsulae]|uniref:Peptidylprolyl isomerase n=1 Tax=Sphingomonas paeninsulae TaxID=2319844 RepID=A0A494TFW3_SPHPE|nr:peptidylprolyl isomerase [Sphingomonas paeninsulae]AYJ86274.1 peptidylprolyl isomerase [Sphingomonas paeninsulae]
MKRAALIAAALLLPAAATPLPPPAAAPSEIIAAAPVADWVTIADADLLIMNLASNNSGHARQVIIQLMPAPFSQGWVANVRMLAAVHWWDGTSVNRVQDNYVAQWGDATGKKTLPSALIKVPPADYTTPRTDKFGQSAQLSADSYAPETGFIAGWPYASDGHEAWSVHCYGMVGIGRDMSPDTGSGAELYAVIGQAPRHLDRNIALVGRVVSGIENLSSLPRGTGALGFYEKPEQRVTIKSIKLAAELPEADRPRFQYLSTESASFAKYADARANRRDPFFIRPAGGADICNVPVPIRSVPIKSP